MTAPSGGGPVGCVLTESYDFSYLCLRHDRWLSLFSSSSSRLLLCKQECEGNGCAMCAWSVRAKVQRAVGDWAAGGKGGWRPHKERAWFDSKLLRSWRRRSPLRAILLRGLCPGGSAGRSHPAIRPQVSERYDGDRRQSSGSGGSSSGSSSGSSGGTCRTCRSRA